MSPISMYDDVIHYPESPPLRSRLPDSKTIDRLTTRRRARLPSRHDRLTAHDPVTLKTSRHRDGSQGVNSLSIVACHAVGTVTYRGRRNMGNILTPRHRLSATHWTRISISRRHVSSC